MRNFAQRWVEDRTFVWLITEEVLDEYREVLARLGVRRPLIGKIVNTLRTKGEHVKLAPTHNLSPDPDDNHICDCAEYGDADFIVTLNPKDFPQSLSARKNNSPRRSAARSAHNNSAQEFMKRVMCNRPDLTSHALLLDEVMSVSCATPCSLLTDCPSTAQYRW